MMSWHSWQRIPNSLPPTNDDNDPDHVPPSSAKVSCSTHWFPVSGTRAEFMLAVKAAFVECREHMFWVKWHRIHEKRVTSRLIIEPAALGKDGVKPWQLHTIVMYSDFAATIKLPRSAEATGSFEQTSQMFVSVMTHDGRLMRVDDLPPGTLKARLKKEGVQAYPYADTTVLYAMSNANNNTDFYGSVLAQALEVVHTGKAPEGSKMEFVHDGVRLAGSDTSRPLAHGLKDWDDAMPPTAPFVKCGHAGQSFVQLGSDGKSFKVIVGMPSGGRTRAIEFRDGCKAQFQGKSAFLVYSLLERITGVEFSNVCCEAKDGKGAADGLSRVVSQGARSLALQGVNAGSESRGLFGMVAAQRRAPQRPRIEKTELKSATNYLFCYAGPADGSAFEDFKANNGYSGPSKDHHYRPDPRSQADDPLGRDQGFVEHWTRPCPCDQHLQMLPGSCAVKRLFLNAVGSSGIERFKGVRSRVATRSRVTSNFVDGIKVGSVVAVRVHSDEPNEHREPYFLGVVERDDGAPDTDPLVWRSNKTQRIESNVFSKNVWLIRFRWLHYKPLAVCADGSRGYQFQPGEKTVVFAAQAVVTRKEPNIALQSLHQADGVWWLSKQSHGTVMKSGMDLLP